MFGQQVQRTLFSRPAAVQSSCFLEIRPRKQQLQKVAAVSDGKIARENHGGGAGEVHDTHGAGLKEPKGAGVVPNEKATSRPNSSSGDTVASAYSENFKQRYGRGRAPK